MDRRDNPYAPGAGLRPPELAGRDKLIEDASIDMERILKSLPTRGMMLLGLRGVGKTVLLNHLFEIARKMDFQVVKIEAPEGGYLPALLVPQLRQILYRLNPTSAVGQKIRQAASVLRSFASAFKVTVGEFEFGIEPAPGRADSGDLEQDLPELLMTIADLAADENTAVGVFLDEIQYLSGAELAALIVACHQIAQRNLPFFFVGAGLPQMAALAGNAKSYAERLFSYPQVGPLEPEAAQEALVKPAENAGARYEPDAVKEILRLTECYPYFIQEWGFHVWNAAPKSPILIDYVTETTPNIIKHLDENFFRVRFDRLTPLQQKYLRAMAELGSGPHKTGDIAATLGVEPSAVATVRQQLINKGMVWSQRHGETAFTVPMFDGFMKRQMPKLERHIPQRRNKATQT